MKRILHRLTASLALVPALLAGCRAEHRAGTTPGDVPVIAASIAPLGWLAEEIGGDSARVIVLLPPGTDAESFEPQMGKLRDLDGAAIFAATGLLPFEAKLADATAGAHAPGYVTLSDQVELIQGTHGEGSADPHVWMSARNMRLMGARLLAAMKESRPSAAEYYTRRWAALDHRLDSLDQAAAAALDSAGRPAFLVWHPSLTYLARDYGLRQVSVGYEGKENSAMGTRARIDAAMALKPKVYFIQADEDPRAAETLPVPATTSKVSVNIMSADWEQELEKIITALK